MKKFFPLLAALLVMSSCFAQYCGNSPNGILPNSDTMPGFNPPDYLMPCITQGVYVSDTIYFTNYSNFAGQIVDSFRFDSIGNLPAGLCWSTSTPTNSFLGAQHGAILISGTTNAPAGQYSIQFFVTVTAGALVVGPQAHFNVNGLGGVNYFLRVSCTNGYCPPVDSANGANNQFIADSTCVASPFTVNITPLSATDICVGSSVTLVASSNSSGNVVYNWSNGASTDSLAISPNVSSNYTVTAVNNSGTTATATITITVHNLPVAGFTLVPDSTPHVWDIINQSSGPGLGIYYIWSWGDGTTTDTTSPTLSHTYDSAGYYAICLSVVDSAGCSANYCDSAQYLYKNQAGQMITIHVIDHSTGINTISTNNLQIHYYAGALHFTTPVNIPSDIKLYDISGREVLIQHGFTGDVMPLNALTQGVYIVRVENNSYSLSGKLPVLR